MDQDLELGQEQDTERERRLADFGRCWAEAERRGDVWALDTLLTDDFTAVGPRGFVLDKKKWLDRCASGALVHDRFTWDEVTVRQYGAAAVAVGVQGQQSVFDGRDADGDFRVTQTIVEVGGRRQPPTSVRPARTSTELPYARAGLPGRRQPRGTTSDWTSGRPFQSLEAIDAWAAASWATRACASADVGFTSSSVGGTFCASVMISR